MNQPRLLAVLLSLCAPIAAADCQLRPLDPLAVPKFAVHPNASLHLIMPEPLTTPVLGNALHWEPFGDPAMPLHYWVRPKAESPADTVSSLTLITATGSYDLQLTRAATVDAGIQCVRFTRGDQAIAAMDLRQDTTTHTPDAALPPAGEYRWRGAQIADVKDDGLYTYVQLAKAPRKLPVLVGGKNEPLTQDFNRDTNTFRIAGLHDVITLIDGKRRTEIRVQ